MPSPEARRQTEAAAEAHLPPHACRHPVAPTPTLAGSAEAPLREALTKCVAAMKMQIGREDESLHIPARVARPIYDYAISTGETALAAAPQPEAEAGGGWLPIEAFDRKQEKAVVLAYGFFRDDNSISRSVQIANWTEWMSHWSVSCLPFRPTHFMPMPTPPAPERPA